MGTRIPGHPGGLLIAGRKKPQLQMVPESHCPPLPLLHRMDIPVQPQWRPAPLNGLRHRRMRRQVKTYPKHPPAQVPGEPGSGGVLQVKRSPL